MSNKNDFTPPEMPIPAELGAPTVGDTTGNWLEQHWDSGSFSYRNVDSLLPPPVPLTDSVTAENPLKVDFMISIRSPYSALMVHRCAWLQSQFNCKVTTRIVLPIAIRNPAYFGGTVKQPGPDDIAPANWYLMNNIYWDALRVAQYQGLDWYRNASPDPIKMDLWPPDSPTRNKIAALEDQPYVLWLVRLFCAAQLAGKSLDWALKMYPIVWADSSGQWPAEIPEAFERVGTGMSYDDTIKDIQANPAKYDAVFLENEKVQIKAGHGGIPVTIFRNEPYYGQDRFDYMFYRLVENGLTRRDEPITPFVDEPLRFLDYDREREIAFG